MLQELATPISLTPLPRELPRPDKRDAGVLGLLLLVLLAVYSATIFFPYAYLDDYFWLDLSVTKPFDLWEPLVVQGRPLNAIILEAVFSHAGGLPGLWRVRLLTLAELAVMGWLFYLAIKWNGWNRAAAFGLAVMACMLPAVQVYAAWATSVPILYSGIAACVGAVLTGWAADNLRRRWAALPVAAGLLLISATIYQPTAMLFWPVAALDLFRRDGDRKLFRRFAIYLAVSTVGLFLAWCVFRIGLATYPKRPSVMRSAMTTDPGGKFTWFIHHPLIDSLNLFNLRPNYWIAAGVGLILLIGIPLYLRCGVRVRGDRLKQFLIAAALFPLSYVPNLVAQESWSSYRTQIGLSWLVLLLAWMGIDGLWHKRHLAARKIVIVIIGVASCALAWWHVTTLIVRPQMMELDALRLELSRLDQTPAQRIILLQPSGTSVFAPYSRYDEFGRYSMEGFWVPQSAVNLIRRERDPKAPRVEVELRPGYEGPFAEKLPPGTMLIDLRFDEPER